MPNQSSQSLMFFFHSHLPYVLCHGRSPHGTDWLSEAAAETYVPLLDALYDLVEEGISPRVTIGVTPVLAEMLTDSVFVYEFIIYLQDKILAAEKDEQAFLQSGDESLAELAKFWQERYQKVFRNFRVRYNKSITGAFKKLQDDGHIEITTSSATHGYSPLLSQDVSIQAQIKQGVQTYKKHFGTDPKGFWLPECAYRPRYGWAFPVSPDGTSPSPYLRKGVEEFLGENGLNYFVIESHLLRNAFGLSNDSSESFEETGDDAIAGVYADRFPALKRLWLQSKKQARPWESNRSIYQAHYIDGKGEDAEPVAVFARDPRTGYQVWSSVTGYPGDGWYLEFHKKHYPGGHKYHRVTGPGVELEEKLQYDPKRAQERVAAHAEHFVKLAKEVLEEESSKLGGNAVICAPFDTELFGHWWFEGVDWLKQVIRGFASEQNVRTRTGSEALALHASDEHVAIPEGSWGEGGFHYVWLNQDNEWTWKLVYDAEARMQSLAELDLSDDITERLVKQAARELFLLQSSDWQFNITTSTSTDYAEMRLNWHYNSFLRLAELAEQAAEGKQLNVDELDELLYREERDSLFQDVNPAWFAKLEHPPK